ncbi:MAG: hypothetical protein ISR64_04590 [Deltaproteobacteria bacterium]|nr:hypothetical protein [Deltaproteobacteria bacterium]
MDRILRFVYRFRWSLIPAFVVLAAVVFRVLWSGYADLSVAEQSREAGLHGTAIDYYGRASRWYCPRIGAHNAARDGLMKLCWDLERRGDDEMALRCFREVRGAILSTRWLWTANKDMLGSANGGIARIVAMEKGPDGEPVLPVDRHMELLERDMTPNPWLSAAAVILFFAWVGVVALGVWRATTREGRVQWMSFARYLGLAAIPFMLWLVALRLA